MIALRHGTTKKKEREKRIPIAIPDNNEEKKGDCYL